MDNDEPTVKDLRREVLALALTYTQRGGDPRAAWLLATVEVADRIGRTRAHVRANAPLTLLVDALL